MRRRGSMERVPIPGFRVHGVRLYPRACGSLVSFAVSSQGFDTKPREKEHRRARTSYALFMTCSECIQNCDNAL